VARNDSYQAYKHPHAGLINPVEW